MGKENNIRAINYCLIRSTYDYQNVSACVPVSELVSYSTWNMSSDPRYGMLESTPHPSYTRDSVH